MGQENMVVGSNAQVKGEAPPKAGTSALEPVVMCALVMTDMARFEEPAKAVVLREPSARRRSGIHLGTTQPRE